VATEPRGRDRDDRGSITPLLVGFLLVLLLLVAVVVDASSAYLHRQRLATLAEGAALQGADLGIAGSAVYENGLGDGPLQVTPARARAAVQAYLSDVGAYRDYPGLRARVSVQGSRVVVELSHAVELPLAVPGVVQQATVTGSGSAIADPQIP
jgi:hypothetical protein